MTHHGKYETKILVLDDERLIRLAVCARLKSAGYDSVSVGTVQEAVSILKAHHRSFSAIISDIMMGDMDGFVFRDIVRGIDDSIPVCRHEISFLLTTHFFSVSAFASTLNPTLALTNTATHVPGEDSLDRVAGSL